VVEQAAGSFSAPLVALKQRLAVTFGCGGSCLCSCRSRASAAFVLHRVVWNELGFVFWVDWLEGAVLVVSAHKLGSLAILSVAFLGQLVPGHAIR
jgi:hypothetical protein